MVINVYDNEDGELGKAHFLGFDVEGDPVFDAGEFSEKQFDFLVANCFEKLSFKGTFQTVTLTGEQKTEFEKIP